MSSVLMVFAWAWLCWAPPDPAADLEADAIESLGEFGFDPNDSLADGIPDNFADAERQLAPMIAEFLDAGAARVVMPLVAIAALLLLVGLIRRRFAAPPDAPSPGPAAAAASLACVGIYALGRAVDPLLASLLHRPAWFSESAWAQIGWFEWKLLGRPWAWGALPLAQHPGLAILVHVVVWALVWSVLRFVLDWVWATGLRWSEPTGGPPRPGRANGLPWYFAWVGASTTRRADRRFRRWLGPIVTLLIPLHVLAGMRLAENPGVLPAPGAWVTGGLLLWTLAFHLLVSGRPPAADKPAEAPNEDAEDEQQDRRMAPLARLREALEQLRPGVELEALEHREDAPGHQAEFPAAIAPLVREIFEDLTGEQRPWTHQAELLDHLGELWRMQAAPERGEVPTLQEEHATAVVSQAQGSTPHALVLAAEGSGRTTLTVLAALHVFFDRGATSLVIVRDRDQSTRWAKTLERALLGSSARWNVLVCVAGEDLTAALVAGRTPAIVVADLEACESEVLCDPRTDEFFGRLGLIVADDVDGFTGVAEMHLQLCVRRLWALLDRLHRAPYPAALLATAGAGASGMDAWAKHVLAVPMRLFAEDGSPSRPRVLLRRRDLVDGLGVDIPLNVLAQACDRAQLPWHLRLAGDAERRVRRAAFDLGDLRRHHCDDPREAAIVIVEGTYPDVRREAARLAHAGMALDPQAFPPRNPVVLVLAPPGDEEMVLHEEAEDALHRELVASLPRAVPLTEPRVVRQRHFDRAIGREQDLRALRDRFGARFVNETVASLGDTLRLREVLHLDPVTDDIVPQTLLRAVKEGALGQPIDASCVSDRSSRTEVVDAGTSEVLLTIDAALARAVYPPGRIFLHPRGRFMILEELGQAKPPGVAVAVEIRAEQIGGRERTTNDRSVTIEVDLAQQRPQWTDRQFGGRTLPVWLTHAQIIESVHGVRRFAPGPVLVDQRIYERPLEVRYGTDACLIDTTVRQDPPVASPSDDALIPLAAALRMIIPGYLRAAVDLVDVDLVDIDGRRALCVFDRTAGGSGFARHVCERGLRELLELARLVLERCVGPEFARLRHIHDRAPRSDPSRWRVSEALAWLDAVLDPPPSDADEAGEPELGGPRVEFTPGEGVGDLGRLWISRTGRTDDLVWTRHSWWSPVPIAGHARGKLNFDVAVERPAIAAARRRAIALAGQLMLRSERLDRASSEAHEQLLEADRGDLEPIRDTLAQLCGDALIDTVLALVAAIPISPRPMTVADRGPLAVLARRRADVDAKLLLACALLPTSACASVVTGPEDQAWLRIDHGYRAGDPASVKTWALDGPRPVLVDEEPARRATMVLDLRED
ncbi:hypothetical protein DB30_01121 [Enhygromyxa salina]|uniref:Uncharacterized protein n=1 Tax=Enhygromyxa salina TaxID=215803 RepID=A0A0C1Z4W4_9BACT|nr:hypothetical protein [Enhygromyxa salina]KIG12684.1 hypothetical protein DB30_01121 [Enhygromyxa salina]